MILLAMAVKSAVALSIICEMNGVIITSSLSSPPTLFPVSPSSPFSYSLSLLVPPPPQKKIASALKNFFFFSFVSWWMYVIT